MNSRLLRRKRLLRAAGDLRERERRRQFAAIAVVIFDQLPALHLDILARKLPIRVASPASPGSKLTALRSAFTDPFTARFMRASVTGER